MQLLFENDHCKISLDESIPALYQEWQGFVTGEPLRQAHDATVQLLRQHQLSRVLADARQMRVIPRADQQWIMDSFFPRAIAAGYRRVAVVQAEDAFNQTSVQNILGGIIQNTLLVAERFRSVPEARIWLKAE